MELPRVLLRSIVMSENGEVVVFLEKVTELEYCFFVLVLFFGVATSSGAPDWIQE